MLSFLADSGPYLLAVNDLITELTYV